MADNAFETAIDYVEPSRFGGKRLALVGQTLTAGERDRWGRPRWTMTVRLGDLLPTLDRSWNRDERVFKLAAVAGMLIIPLAGAALFVQDASVIAWRWYWALLLASGLGGGVGYMLAPLGVETVWCRYRSGTIAVPVSGRRHDHEFRRFVLSLEDRLRLASEGAKEAAEQGDEADQR